MALKNYTDHLNISTENLDLYDNRFVIKDIIDLLSRDIRVG